MKNLFDTMAYMGGVLFFVLMLFGLIVYVAVTIDNLRKEDDEANEDYKPYDWDDME